MGSVCIYVTLFFKFFFLSKVSLPLGLVLVLVVVSGDWSGKLVAGSQYPQSSPSYWEQIHGR